MGEESRESVGNGNKYPIFDVWKEYEEIAMHFNNLIVQLRLRALGRVAVILTVFGFAFRGDLGASSAWGLLAVVIILLSVAWVAVWILDMRYYNRLLRGAVLAIIEIERLSTEGKEVKELNLSRWVEKSVRGDKELKGKLAAPIARNAFYGIIILALMGTFLFVFNGYCDLSYSEPDKTHFRICKCFVE